MFFLLSENMKCKKYLCNFIKCNKAIEKNK